MAFKVAAFYQFTVLPDYRGLREPLHAMCAALGLNGSVLLAAGGRGGHSGSVVLFDVKTGQRIAKIGDELDAVLTADINAQHSLVALGGPSAKVVIGTPDGIMKLRGNWRIHRTPSGKEIPVMPTLHPAYLLRNPAHKRLAWRDFLEIKARLRAAG